MPLFELIKTSSTSSKPLIYTGFDSQNFNASFDFMSEAFIHLKAQNSRKYFDLLYKYYEIPGLISMADYAELESLEDSIQEGCSGVRLLLDSYSYELKKHYQLNDTTISYLYRAVDNLEASITLDWGLDNPYARRDSIMASNLIWLMEQVYPTKKFVVWAHNGHVDKPYAANTFMKSMGQYIMEKYGDRSYHIGIFCRKGKAYQWWQKDEIAFNNEQTDDLEQKMISQGESLRFIDVNSCSSITTYDWMNNTAFAWEPENGGRINFVPSERFDALICFDSVNPPTYDKP
jgi:erythromycin esterase